MLNCDTWNNLYSVNGACRNSRENYPVKQGILKKRKNSVYSGDFYLDLLEDKGKEQPMPGILYAAYQKFYSALNCLERFDKEKDFFENISNLDGFFSEFRNVTFVLQKAIAHTEYAPLYEKNRNKYLADCKWFVEKRNEITKQHPFQLVKEIEIHIYFPGFKINVLSKKFTVENDVELSTMLEEIKRFLLVDQANEIFFSAKFSFYEKETEEDLYDKLTDGIRAMGMFLNAMKRDINEQCELCETLADKISKMHFAVCPKDMLFVIDYVYYPDKDEFERAGRMAMVPGIEGVSRVPLTNLDKTYHFSQSEDYFKKFVMMHVSMGTADLMPAIWKVYPDNTAAFDLFNSDIKTTMYRKINEAAESVLETDLTEVYCMLIYTLCAGENVSLETTSKERLTYGVRDYLTFMKVDKFLNEEEYFFDSSKLKDREYIRQQLELGKSKQLNLGRINMLPIIQAFKKKRDMS